MSDLSAPVLLGGLCSLLCVALATSTRPTRYAEIWEKNGAVDPAVGACRVLHEVMNATMERTGMFINCEDGLEIPW